MVFGGIKKRLKEKQIERAHLSQIRKREESKQRIAYEKWKVQEEYRQKRKQFRKGGAQVKKAGSILKKMADNVEKNQRKKKKETDFPKWL